MVNETWNFEQNHNVASAVATGEPIELAGDGRCDSPGHSAKYCTYSMQNMATGKIMTLNITQVTQAGSSNNMEKLGCVNALDNIDPRDSKLPSLQLTDTCRYGSICGSKDRTLSSSLIFDTL